MAGLAPQVLAALALVLGAMLVFSGVTPARGIDLEWLGSFLPLPLIEGAHFLATVLGALLMISARGLAFRLDGAWWTALARRLRRARAVAGQGGGGLRGGGAGALRRGAPRLAPRLRPPGRRCSEPRLTAPWIAAVAVVLISALVILRFVFDHAEFGTESWLRFEISAEAPRGLRALFGASLLAGLAAVWSLLRPARPAARGAGRADDLARAVAIVAAQPVAAANLVRMGDKRLIFSDDGRGLRDVRPPGQLLDRALRSGRAGRGSGPS